VDMFVSNGCLDFCFAILTLSIEKNLTACQ
jgi:hypothetical protein